MLLSTAGQRTLLGLFYKMAIMYGLLDVTALTHSRKEILESYKRLYSRVLDGENEGNIQLSQGRSKVVF